MPGFQNPTEADKASRWFEMTQKNCFPKGSSGSSSLTMFGQSWSSRRDSSASSKQGSLGSQEWGQMVDQVILDEMNAFKENIGNLSNKLSVF